MVEIEKLVKAETASSSGTNINVLDFLKVVDNIITKVDNIEKSKAGREQQQPKIIDVPAPAPVIQQPVQQVIQPQPVAPVQQQPVQPQNSTATGLTEQQKNEMFENYFQQAMKYADLYIVIFGDTSVSVMKENLTKEKEMIKKQVLANI